MKILGIFLLLHVSNKHQISSQGMQYFTRLVISVDFEEVSTALQSRNFAAQFRTCCHQMEYLNFNISSLPRLGNST